MSVMGVKANHRYFLNHDKEIVRRNSHKEAFYLNGQHVRCNIRQLVFLNHDKEKVSFVVRSRPFTAVSYNSDVILDCRFLRYLERRQ